MAESQPSDGVSLRWNRTSYFLLSMFLALIALIIAVWWPLAEAYLGSINPDFPIWAQVDWLLIGIFLVMSVLIMSGADLRVDAWTAFVAAVGGLTIEAWGTQTLLWTYYTDERPPLWIVPAWPIATLAIDRICRLLGGLYRRVPERWTARLFWIVFGGFYLLMVYYVRGTFDKPFTLAALLLCALIIISPGDKRAALLLFAGGAGLGYFLELWGTTRECWTYYTRETPPLFAVLAHGMAATAFWRAGAILKLFYQKAREVRILRGLPTPSEAQEGPEITSMAKTQS
ncbi:MAG: hypothetical protein JW929_16430 [Anaerolineales bacterium]|nr:hypothetical protein [Anaerolineales bacterium]